MRDTNLVNALREHAEWAEGNQWETPITLGDDLTEAADRIEAQAKEIEKLRRKVPRLIPVEERLPELQSWGASTVVLGLIKSENAPSLNTQRFHGATSIAMIGALTVSLSAVWWLSAR